MNKKVVKRNFIPVCVVFKVSHIWTWLSSEPQNKWRPLNDNAHDVKPDVPDGEAYFAICWSDRISYKRADLSSEPVAKANPLGWN